MTNFIISNNTQIKIEGKPLTAIKKAVAILKRDLDAVLEESAIPANVIKILFEKAYQLEEETFQICFSDCGTEMLIKASDELGAVYGILYISRYYLGIQPFWFWDNQVINKVAKIEIPMKSYQSTPAKVRFRGWFVNDEVLLMGWKNDPNDQGVWEAVFEALLRCGGNMVIPGTDNNSRLNRNLASNMGLWITHHHAEPLGAEMFARQYPEAEANYSKHPDLFEKLWREAIIEQKESKVIWNLGFRGQGDRPFWADDPTYTDAKSRGQLISQIITKQYELIHEYIENPQFCTNLYGEIMELYQQGYIQTPKNIIKIWADSGYGKMVSRRQGRHNPRIPSLPNPLDQGPHGLYYHVTFYDLQASNHLTMLPNSPQFVIDELQKALGCQVDHFYIINSGNIKPHTYLLDLVSQIWEYGKVNIDQHLDSFIAQRYTTHRAEISQIYQDYFQSTLPYGQHEDEKAGEQYYHYSIRNIIYHWLKNHETATKLIWLTGAIPFEDQIQWLLDRTSTIASNWESLYQQALNVQKQLTGQEQENFSNSILLQIQLHHTGCQGLIYLCRSYQSHLLKKDLDAYIFAQEGKAQIEAGLTAMNQVQQGRWEHFYRNDCLTNVELTVYCLQTLCLYLRMIGDGPSFYQWEKEYLYAKSDQKVELVTNFSKPLTDNELAKNLKSKISLKSL